ncbi:MAG: c-type cytochrome [Thermoleophilia bacterium]|nr:c-type cytochrome [Thermoleophilia bacterium]
MANPEQREQFSRYKDDVQRRGKAFYPHAMFHDTVMSLVVVAVIAGLAAIWYFDSGEKPGDAGILGPRYTEEADPGTTSFVPRPDWYFYFLFYLLRIFKWPESVVLGTVGIPTILLIILLMVPFFDRRRERRIVRRPVAVVASLLVIASMGILTYKGATAEEPSATSGEALLTDNNIPTDNDQVVQGASLFGGVGCLNCHTYASQGAQGPGPELSKIGELNRGEDYWVRWVRNPQDVKPGSPMPGFPNLTDEQLQAIAAFLEASKPGGGGG